MKPLLKINPYELFVVETGRFGLDGGAMFGVVPKPLWEKKTQPDTQNRIPLAARALLLRSADRIVLIETGLGTKMKPKERDIYAVDQTSNNLMGSLAALGVKPSDVTDVLLTHLHFDHAGGATTEKDGKIIPTFPRAMYHIQEKNFRHARNPTLRDRASYLPEDFMPLQAVDQLQLHHTAAGFEHDEEVLPGIQAIVCHGHTPGLQMLKISDGENTVVYCADTIPTKAHLPVSWVMGYDLQPLVSLEERANLLQRCKKHNWLLFFGHDPDLSIAAVEFDAKDRPSAKSLS